MISPQYLAGLIDGEGNICLYIAGKKNALHGKNAGLRVCITNTYLPILITIQQMYGGSLRFMKRMPRCKQAYQLTWNGRKARRILEDIREHCIIKKQQVEIAFEFYRLRDDPSRLESKRGSGMFGSPHRKPETVVLEFDMKRRMNELNKRGA